MKQRFVALFSGVLFALGLGVSGMTQPAKVTAFLDFTGAWDPSLALVMVGAILVYALGMRLTSQHPSKPKRIEKTLLAGAAIFGVGWGLAGFCPGPALVSLVTLNASVLVFVCGLILGTALFLVLPWSKTPAP